MQKTEAELKVMRDNCKNFDDFNRYMIELMGENADLKLMLITSIVVGSSFAMAYWLMDGRDPEKSGWSIRDWEKYMDAKRQAEAVVRAAQGM